MRYSLLSIFAFILPLAAVAQEQPPPPDVAVAPVAGPMNIEAPTWGGKLFWSDELVFHDWRIQRHVYTGHCRLLDSDNYRRAWGTLEHCRQQLEGYKVRFELPPLKEKVVVLLHGLIRSRDVMDDVEKHFEDNSAYEVVNMSYASTRGQVGEHAQALAKVIDNLGDVREINFVAHSMGNLVIRHYLADQIAANGKIDPRIHRFVMLAPPNNGSHVAEFFKGNAIFGMIWGRGGKQIANWDDLADKLVTPPCEFAVMAGRRSENAYSNPLLEGDNDFVVTVKETKLAGAADFICVPTYHGGMMHDAKSLECMQRFIERGFFVSAEERCPLVEEVAAE